MAETATVQALAGEAYSWFETARRATGDTETGPREEGERYTRCKDGAPEWVTELVHDAHGDFLPDDWRYDAICSALEFISETDDPEDGASEWADSNVDVYTGARLAWLASNLNRAGYCVDAAGEYGSSATDIVAMIGQGQYAESREVFYAVLSALEERAEATEAEEAGA